MPLESADFPVEVQVAFFIYGFLEDNWDGMTGTYLGKNWGTVQYFFNLYDIDEPKVILNFMKMYETIIVEYRAEEADKKRKREERLSSGGAKNYTHNVKG